MLGNSLVCMLFQVSQRVCTADGRFCIILWPVEGHGERRMSRRTLKVLPRLRLVYICFSQSPEQPKHRPLVTPYHDTKTGVDQVTSEWPASPRLLPKRTEGVGLAAGGADGEHCGVTLELSVRQLVVPFLREAHQQVRPGSRRRSLSTHHGLEALNVGLSSMLLNMARPFCHRY